MTRLSAFLTLLFAAFPFTGATAGTGHLLIEVDAVELNNLHASTNIAAPVTGFSLKSITTGKTESFLFPNGLQLEEIEEGEYCLYSIEIGRRNTFIFCEPPHMRVISGKVTNAGRWRYGVQGNLESARRLASFQRLEESASLAKTQFSNRSDLLSQVESARVPGPLTGRPQFSLSFLEKPYSEWVEMERDILRSFYDGLPKTDSPPYPVKGLSSLQSALWRLPAEARRGTAKVYLTVNSLGQVVGTEIVKGSSAQAAALIVEMASTIEFVPPVCAAGPCRMDFPVFVLFN